MTPPVRSRRDVLVGGLAAGGLLLAGCGDRSPAAAPPTPSSPSPADELAALERRSGGRLGVFGLDTATGAQVGHRADERFLMCSTSKVLTVTAILRGRRPGALDERVRYRADQVVANSPVTGAHVADGLTVAQLCAAAITRSDNTAENLLLARVGGPPGQTAFLRSIGDDVSRSDRYETDLNTGGPGDERDTSTPARMARTLQAVALGDVLDPPGRDLLVGWLRANTTGATRVRAGLPPGWTTGDKTGSGNQGEVNDLAVTWPPGRAPLIVAVYTVPADPARPIDAAVPAAAAIVARALS